MAKSVLRALDDAPRWTQGRGPSRNFTEKGCQERKFGVEGETISFFLFIFLSFNKSYIKKERKFHKRKKDFWADKKEMVLGF
jgi:hypothetical protein